MAANLISLNSFTTPAFVPVNGNAADVIAINPKDIVSARTRATAYLTTGVTDVVYNLPVNGADYQITLIVTQTVAQVITAANAVSVAA